MGQGPPYALHEEIFGPVMLLMCCGSIQEAVAIANDSLYRLAACFLRHGVEGTVQIWRMAPHR